MLQRSGNLSFFSSALRITALVGLAQALLLSATREVGTGQSYSTIQACLNASSSGDVCSVHAGVYTEQISLPRSGASGNPIVLRSYGSDSVRVQSTSSPVISIAGKSYWTISGITFEYNGSGSSPYVFSNTTGNGNVNGITIENCVARISSGSGSGFGIYIAKSDQLVVTGTTIDISSTTGAHDGADLLFSSNLQFTNNVIQGNASASTGRLEDGLVLSGTNLNIENNILHDGWSYDTHPDGIVVQGDGDRSGNRTANVKVVRNTVYNFTQGIYFDAIHNPLEGANLIANNVVYETSAFRYGGAANKMNAIVIDGESLTSSGYAVSVDVYNNTLDARQLHVYVARTAAGSVINIKNNIFVNAPYTAAYITSTYGVSMNNNYYKQGNQTAIKWGGSNYSLASFINAGLGESQGRSGSGALSGEYSIAESVDTFAFGLNLSSVFTTDRIGAPRPSTAAWDVGAYQSGAVSATPPIPSNLSGALQ